MDLFHQGVDKVSSLSGEDIKKLAIDAGTKYFQDNVIHAAIDFAGKLISPASGAVQAIFNGLDFVLTKGKDLAGVIRTVIQGIGAVADGDTGGLKLNLKNALSDALPLFIGLVSSQIPLLKNLPAKVKETLGKLRDKVAEKLNAFFTATVDKFKEKLGFGQHSADYKGIASDVLTWRQGSESHRLWVVVRENKAIVLIASGQGHSAFQELSELAARVPKDSPLSAKIDTALNLLVEEEKLTVQRAELFREAGSIGQTANSSRLSGESSPGARLQQQRAAKVAAEKLAMADKVAGQAAEKLISVQKLIKEIREAVEGPTLIPASTTAPNGYVRTRSITWNGVAYTVPSEVQATVYTAGYPHKNFPDSVPSWWDLFVSSNSPTVTWNKGHVVGSQFGGTLGADNVVPEYERVNLSPVQRADNRIKDLIGLGTGPIVETIVINYNNTGSLTLAPSSLEVSIRPRVGPPLMGTIDNVVSPGIPTAFRDVIRRWPPV